MFCQPLKKLLDLDVPKDGHGNDLPSLLRLEPEADELWRQFRAEIEPQLGQDGRLHALRGWGGKVAGTCLRVAGLLHIAEHGTATPLVQASAMQRASVICRALLEHALAAFAMMQTEQAVQDVETIYQWILARVEARLGRTECLKKFHGRFTNKKRYEAALETLRHHNVISDMRKEKDEGTGRVRQYYDVNPMLFDRKA